VRPRNNNTRGFTLLEVIIAVTLVSVLLLGVFGAVRLGIDSMERIDSRMLRERRVAGVEQIMRSQLEGMMPVAAQCGGEGEAAGPRVPFFQGEPSTMRFVSTYSLNERERGLPRILEYQVIPGENGEGVRLVLNEHVYTGPRSAGASCLGVNPDAENPGPRFAPVDVGEGSFVLADKLAECRFEFREPRYDGEIPRWFPRWSRPVFPDSVRINLAPLHPQSSQLDLQTLTVPLHLMRDPMAQYAQ